MIRRIVKKLLRAPVAPCKLLPRVTLLPVKPRPIWRALYTRPPPLPSLAGYRMPKNPPLHALASNHIQQNLHLKRRSQEQALCE